MKKRLFGIVMLLLLFSMIAVPALAVDDPVVVETVIDWGRVTTEVIVGTLGLLGLIATTLLGYIGRKYVVPWLEQKKLLDLAKTLVQAAEAELGRFTGALKLEQVIEWFAIRGYSIDELRVAQAIQSAWLELNYKMIELGLKDAPGPDAFAGTEQPVPLE